jgi:hypothetical protein
MGDGLFIAGQIDDGLDVQTLVGSLSVGLAAMAQHLSHTDDSKLNTSR